MIAKNLTIKIFLSCLLVFMPVLAVAESESPAAGEIFQKALAKLHKLESFKTTLLGFNKGFLFHMKPVKVPRVGIATFNIVFQRPRRLYLKIVKSIDSPEVDNTRLYFDGGPKVKIK